MALMSAKALMIGKQTIGEMVLENWHAIAMTPSERTRTR